MAHLMRVHVPPPPRSTPTGWSEQRGVVAERRTVVPGILAQASRSTTMYGSVALETTNPFTVVRGFHIVTVTDSDPEPVAKWSFLVSRPNSSSPRGDVTVHLEERPTTKPYTSGFDATVAVRA